MSATNSSSTLPDETNQHNLEQPTSASGTPAPTAAVPYGTRSRNRGAPRPNYAEDPDIEGDLESVTAASSKSKRVSSLNASNSNRTSTPGSETEKGTGVSTRRTHAIGGSGVAKEPIPGTSTFSANPNHVTNGSKKRKQPGSNQTVHGTTTPNGTVSSKGFIAAASQVEGPPVSTMMSFHKYGPYLKDGKLKADDGTELALNGACSPVYLVLFIQFLESTNF
jgi:hypothetical protein